MTDNLTWQQIHELINTMLKTLETKQSVTRTISRTNYNEVLSVLTNRTQFKYDKNLHLKLDVSYGAITIHIRKRRKQ